MASLDKLSLILKTKLSMAEAVLANSYNAQVYEKARIDLDLIHNQFVETWAITTEDPNLKQYHVDLSSRASSAILNLIERENQVKSITTVPSAPNPSVVPSFKLPNVKLPIFSGDPSEWDNFWSLYNTVVHSKSDLDNVLKFNFLLSSLQKEPLEIAKTLPVTEHNYDVVIKLLKDRYEQKDRLLDRLLMSLQTLQTPAHKAKELFSFFTKYTAIVSQYEHKTGNLMDERVVISLVLSKLTSETRRFIQNHNKKTTFTLKEMGDALQFLVDSFEQEELYNSSSSCSKSKEVVRDTKPKSFAKPHFQNKPFNAQPNSMQQVRKCFLCNGSHNIYNCANYTSPNSKRARVKELNLCFNCLKNDHAVDACRSTKSCINCNQRHHASLCFSKSQNPVSSSNYVANSQISCNGNCKSETKSKNAKLSHKEKGSRNAQREQTDEQKTRVEHVATVTSNPDVTPPASPVPPMSTVTSKATCRSEKTGSNVNPNAKTFALRHSAVPTAIISLKSGNGCSQTRAFFDTGSQRSYISTSLAKELGLKSVGEVTLSLSTFGEEIKQITCPIVSCNLHLGNFKMRVKLLVHDKVDMTVKTPGLSNVIKSLKENKIKLADDIVSDKVEAIQLIIGIDYFAKFILSQSVYEGVNLFVTAGGSIPFGPLPLWADSVSQTDDTTVSTQFALCYKAVSDESDLNQLWELDNVGLASETFTPDDVKAKNLVIDSLTYERGQYQVRLPFKEGLEPPSNFASSKAQLDSLYHNKFAKDLNLCNNYDKVFDKYLELKFIEQVPIDPHDGHFLPHHPVVKDSLTTPVRAVFNASNKCKDQLSLNDCLYTGPSLVSLLFEKLIEFRFNDNVAIADISKAFHRILVHPEHRKYLKFLLYRNNRLSCYQFTCVPFGVTSSPFILQQVLHHHLSRVNTTFAKELISKFYVDNLIVTSSDLKELILMKPKIDNIMQNAGMPLQSWISNNPEFNENFKLEEPVNQNVLGLNWNVVEDTINVKMPNMEVLLNNLTITKRGLLKCSATLFDPLGLLNPLVISLRLLLQEAWKESKKWDEKLSSELSDNIKLTFSGINNFQINFPRMVVSSKGHLHCFSDASIKAYGCVAYVLDSCSNQCNLLTSKVKVAPLKNKLTIPKLELAGLTLASRLCKTLTKIFNFQSVTLWCDSQVAIAWAHNPTKTKDVFVANRANEINLSNFDIKYVESKENPADLITRGNNLSQAKYRNLWLYGPSWLNLENSVDVESSVVNLVHVNHCSNITCHYNCHETIDSLGESHDSLTTHSTISCHIVQQPIDKLFQLEKKSSLNFWVNVVKVILKFTNRSHLNPLLILIKQEQMLFLNSFIKYFRDGSTLTNWEKIFLNSNNLTYDINTGCLMTVHRIPAKDELKVVPFLPKKSLLTTMLLRELHIRHHHASFATLMIMFRNEFYTTNLRCLSKTTVRSCVSCKKAQARLPTRPPLPPLPAARTSYTHPFTNVGVDHTGYYNVVSAEGQEKCYVFLASCMATRAVYLDVTKDLSAAGFLYCLRRLASTHGMPQNIYLDNAPGFVSYNEFMKKIKNEEFVQQNDLQFKFITPRSPWKAGHVERLVGLIKNAMSVSIRRKRLTFDELRTITKEIECIVNSRPITYVEDDKDVLPLTPSMLVKGKNVTLSPIMKISNDETYDNYDNKKLRQAYQTLQQTLQRFQENFRNRYINLLDVNSRNRKNFRRWNPSVGEVVLLRTDKHKFLWPLVKIVECFPDKENHIRTVKVFDGTKDILRDPCHLVPLDVHSDSDNSEVINNEHDPSEYNEHNDPSEYNEHNDPSDNEHNTEESVNYETQGARPKRRAALQQRTLMKELVSNDVL